MIKRVLIFIMTLGLLPCIAGAFAIPEANIVVDQAGAINQVETLRSELITYQQQTGHEIAVLVVPTLDGEPIEMVANDVFRKWGIGSEERNDGVLILVAVNDRAARIEVGYGLEGALPDITANRILNEIVFPQFKEGNYDAGIRAGVTAVMQSIAGEPVFPKQTSPGWLQINPVFVITIGIFLFNFFWMMFGHSKAWWHGGVFGGVVGGIIGIITGTLATAGIALVAGTVVGLVFDFFASKFYKPPTRGGGSGPFFFGGGGFGGGSGFGGGGFGGFGGGSSGGGGASGRW